MRRFRPLPLVSSVRLVGLVFNRVFLRIRRLEAGSSFRRYCSLSGAQRLPRFGPDRNETRATWKWSVASAVLSGRDCARRSAASRSKRRNGGAVSAASRGERPSELETILNRVRHLPGYVYVRVRLVRAEEGGDQDRSEVRLCQLAPGCVRLQPRRRRACPPSSRTPRGVNRPCCGTGLERRPRWLSSATPKVRARESGDSSGLRTRSSRLHRQQSLKPRVRLPPRASRHRRTRPVRCRRSEPSRHPIQSTRPEAPPQRADCRHCPLPAPWHLRHSGPSRPLR